VPHDAQQWRDTGELERRLLTAAEIGSAVTLVLAVAMW